MDTKKYTLNIKGMTCEHCVGRVKQALDIKSISKVKVSLKNGEVNFKSDSIDGSAIIEKAKDAIRNIGYEV